MILVSRRLAVLTVGEELDPESIFGLCPVHGERINHFYCYPHNALCCRACTEETHNAANRCVIADCYELRPEEIRDILTKVETGGLAQPGLGQAAHNASF